MVITANLHTTLQKVIAGRLVRKIRIDLPDGATVGDLLIALEIQLPISALMLVRRQNILEVSAVLEDADEIDIIPALSGG